MKRKEFEVKSHYKNKLHIIKIFLNLIEFFDNFNKQKRKYLLVILDLFTIFLTAIFINFIFSDSYLENYKIFGQRSILTLIFLGFFTYRITSNYISITRYIRAIEIYKIAFINLILNV